MTKMVLPAPLPSASVTSEPRRRPRPVSAHPARPLSALGDETLARLAARGSERAFAALYDRYGRQLHRYCHSIVRHDADAQDALQATLLSAYRALCTGRRDAPLRPWLFRIAHNESISLLRRRPPQAELTEDAAQVPAPEEAAGVTERLDRLVADLRRLPERQRGALVMRELSGLGHNDIARALECSPSAARQAIFEARRALLELQEGRDLACDAVCRRLSDGDRRFLRGRKLRAHLRDCPSCAAFAAAIPARSADLNALAPVMPATAAMLVLARALRRAARPVPATGRAAGRAGAGAAGKGAVAATGVKLAGVAAVATTAVAVVHVAVAPSHPAAAEAPARVASASVSVRAGREAPSSVRARVTASGLGAPAAARGGSAVARGGSAVAREAPAIAHGGSAVAHGESAAAHGKSAAAHGKSAAAHGKSAAAHGASAAAHRRGHGASGAAPGRGHGVSGAARGQGVGHSTRTKPSASAVGRHGAGAAASAGNGPGTASRAHSPAQSASPAGTSVKARARARGKASAAGRGRGSAAASSRRGAGSSAGRSSTGGSSTAVQPALAAGHGSKAAG